MKKSEKLIVGAGVLDSPLPKRNAQKGITLIALVITIIVLLILAVVSVQIITNQGIIGHAENAASLYEQKQDNELEQLNLIEQELNQYATGSDAETNNNWWDLTEEELSELTPTEVNGNLRLYVIASNEEEYYTQSIYVAVGASGGNETDAIAMQFVDRYDHGKYGTYYGFYTNDTFKDDVSRNFENCKWYFAVNSSYLNATSQVYTGTVPSQILEFTDDQIYCQTYLQRIIDSFNNE